MEQPTIRARRIELVDEHSNLRMTLDGGKPGPCIRFWSKDGNIKGKVVWD